MKLRYSAAAGYAALALLTAAEITPAQRGKLLYEDDFSGTTLAEGWKVAKGKWQATGGAVLGVELAADKHAAVIRRDLKMKDAVVESRLRMEPGAKMAAISINGAGGHLCRVTLRPDMVIVQKDKMNAKATEPAVVLAKMPMKVSNDKWYKITMEMRGNKLTARIDDGQPFGGEHSSINLEKTNIGLPVAGEGVWFDYLRVWETR
ncbi:MAG: hypothetical protein HY820_04930 [Acidobacteria bacterium]|nr:hypothetical protein [Acidobacteriota bacterium]